MLSKKIENEYMTIAANNAWEQVYHSIGQRSAAFKFTCEEAKKTENKPLNRYRDVNPFDHTRVILQRGDIDYINANFLKVERANRNYILTQGPLVYSVPHFWSMVWEQDARVIVMLNKLIEKNEIKCHWYWPHSTLKDDDLILDDVCLIVSYVGEEDFDFYTVRTFKMTDTNTEEQRTVLQFHYTTWPDFEVPSSPVEFLKFLQKVRETGFLERTAPAIVHCSAGIGRSGTFCLVDSVLMMIEKEGQDNIDIQQLLLEMRQFRMGLIQTSEQLRFSYMAIIEGIKRLDPDFVEPPEAENIYSTVDKDDEEAPPPPPPRGESLARPPARPLPAIPTSTSLDNMDEPIVIDSSSDEEETAGENATSLPSPIVISSDEEMPGPEPLDLSYPALPGESEADRAEQQRMNEILQNIKFSPPSVGKTCSLEHAALRRRRINDMAERIATMKRKSLEADRFHAFKRSLCNPIVLSFGCLLAGIMIYAYIKH